MTVYLLTGGEGRCFHALGRRQVCLFFVITRIVLTMLLAVLLLLLWYAVVIHGCLLWLAVLWLALLLMDGGAWRRMTGFTTPLSASSSLAKDSLTWPQECSLESSRLSLWSHNHLLILILILLLVLFLTFLICSSIVCRSSTTSRAFVTNGPLKHSNGPLSVPYWPPSLSLSLPFFFQPPDDFEHSRDGVCWRRPARP